MNTGAGLSLLKTNTVFCSSNSYKNQSLIIQRTGMENLESVIFFESGLGVATFSTLTPSFRGLGMWKYRGSKSVKKCKTTFTNTESTTV